MSSTKKAIITAVLVTVWVSRVYHMINSSQLHNRYLQPSSTQKGKANATNWTQRIADKRSWLRALHSQYPTNVSRMPSFDVWKATPTSICQQKKELYRNFVPDASKLRNRSTKKHAIVVPFRNRNYHLEHFIPYMSSYLKFHYPDHEFSLWIIEQDDEKLFNRAWLMNVGLDHVPNDTECVILHDVDLVPGYFSRVPYTDCSIPTLLGSEIQSHGFEPLYQNFAGAVVSIHHEHWAAINGMSNVCYGWGAEDDELFRRLLYRGLFDCSTCILRRPPKGSGVFLTIDQSQEKHVREKEYRAMQKTHLKVLKKWDKKGVGRSEFDGWSFNNYNVTDRLVLMNDVMDPQVLADPADNQTKGFTAIYHIKVVQEEPTKVQ